MSKHEMLYRMERMDHWDDLDNMYGPSTTNVGKNSPLGVRIISEEEEISPA